METSLHLIKYGIIKCRRAVGVRTYLGKKENTAGVLYFGRGDIVFPIPIGNSLV